MSQQHFDDEHTLNTLREFDRLAQFFFRRSAANGFWEAGPLPALKSEKIALMHSELSEALEGVRKPGPDGHCPNFTSEEIEIADLFIRAFDYCGAYRLRIGQAIATKMVYNATRPYKHGKAF